MGAERRDMRRGCSMNRNGMNGNQVREELRAIDFALVETSLYLDAYPNCQKALTYYHQLLAKRAVLAEQYVKVYGPLTHRDDLSGTSWQWVKTPWPWECDAN